MAPTPPKIALIGAGPASLTLAAILAHNTIPFTIYESSTALRHQGGSLDLHPAAGQAALKEAGLWAQFVKHARPESDVAKLVELHTGEVFWDENGADKKEVPQTEEELFAGRPEIDRAALQKITFEALPEGSVKWGRKLEKVVPSVKGEGKHDLIFADGTTETEFDLVIGGDGAWSKVRPLLTDVQPQYSGITLVEVWHSDVKSHPWLLEYVGAGMVLGMGEGCAVLSQRQGDGSLRTYGCLRVPESFVETCGIDWNDKEKARVEYMERYFNHVDANLQKLFLECKEDLTARPLYELPVPFTFPHRRGVTLIGDAAHLMSPFAGVGVNVGMTDSLGLAREIIAVTRGEKTLDDAVSAYEQAMFPYAEKNMRKTLKGKKTTFSQNGSKEMASMMRAGHEAMKVMKTQKSPVQAKDLIPEA
ncbi:FAD/NAD(P)-binding domain-containing protein [Byssothecium circinans]|uniref:FAD/NAD(P)-binding domain-containing protein n=1 Tax=Byssothecium circinans TaxID=147558 RepID=A0A6A5TGG1_9PLEO|nr:FAD/NAD(P)-binding domain-containing protein [Byssothecium circinans]